MLLDILPSDLLLDRGCPIQRELRAATAYDSLVDDYITGIEAELGISSNNPLDELHHHITGDPLFDEACDPIDDNLLDGAILNDWYGNLVDDDDIESNGRSPRSPNLYPYQIGDLEEANWYKKFLQPSVRDKTYHLSALNRYGQFRTHFRVPLKKVDDLVELFLTNGWIDFNNHCQTEIKLWIKAQLLILSCLNILGHGTPFRALNDI